MFLAHGKNEPIVVDIFLTEGIGRPVVPVCAAANAARRGYHVFGSIRVQAWDNIKGYTGEQVGPGMVYQKLACGVKGCVGTGQFTSVNISV